jgi:long-subunit fatty acid transport protein
MSLICCLFLFSAQAQNEISSPYSSYGIGVVSRSSNGILDAMGGVSYAMQNPYFINFRNPASYAAFDSLSFVADVAASVFVSKLNQGPLSQQNTYARPGYLAIGLPVTRHWRTSVGILPFSSIGYTIETVKEVENIGLVDYKYSGEGGLHQLYWGNAFKICKGLSFGLNVSYIFGSVYAYNNTEFHSGNYLNSYVKDAYYVDGIYYTAGLQYFFNIGEKHRVGLGAVYSNTAYIWARENLMVNSYSGTFVSTAVYDTVLTQDGVKGTLNIPQSVGGGISYSYKGKLTLAGDVTWQNWDNYRFMKPADSMHNSITGSLGIQFIPDPVSNKFFKKMAFRLGGRYSTGELMLRNKLISEFGVCIGVGVPLTTFNTHSSINIMFEYGKTGTLSNNLVLQNYFRFSFCFTLQERWYQRVKLD